MINPDLTEQQLLRAMFERVGAIVDEEGCIITLRDQLPEHQSPHAWADTVFTFSEDGKLENIDLQGS